MHRYQREDSVWANEYCTPLEDLPNGFDESVGELLPAFVRYDVRTGSVTPLNPDANPIVAHPAAEFGDDWSERLQGDDVEQIRRVLRPHGSAARRRRRHHVPRRRRGPRRPGRPGHRAHDPLRGAPELAHGLGEVGDLRRPPHRQLHEDDAVRRLAHQVAASRLHRAGREVRRQRPCVQSGRHGRVRRGVPAPGRPRLLGVRAQPALLDQAACAREGRSGRVCPRTPRSASSASRPTRRSSADGVAAVATGGRAPGRRNRRCRCRARRPVPVRGGTGGRPRTPSCRRLRRSARLRSR